VVYFGGGGGFCRRESGPINLRVVCLLGSKSEVGYFRSAMHH